jgi:hypothetical protein
MKWYYKLPLVLLFVPWWLVLTIVVISILFVVQLYMAAMGSELRPMDAAVDVADLVFLKFGDL